jgi:DNA repair protein RadC
MQQLKPREKSEILGFESLSLKELFALILRHGSKNSTVFAISEKLEDLFFTYEISKHKEYIEKVKLIDGLGEHKAKTVIATIELAKKLFSEKTFVYNSPEKIVSRFSYLKNSKQEKVILVFLNQNMQVISQKTLFRGTIDFAVVNIREIFIQACQYKARYILLIHNHPSGSAEPSEKDILETKRIREASLMMDIPLIDHIIIARWGYVSFRERALI